ncbi:MAG: protease modulator HflC [Buchnera aphidicola (Meitanaphis microgallis)]
MNKVCVVVGSMIFIFLFLCLFIVQEGQRGIILRFGKVLRNSQNQPIVYNPGLYVKFPLIDTVKMLDSRIQTMDNQADRFVTREKKDLIVDSYIKWNISDFSRYYLATGGGDIAQAEILLKRKFSDRLRSEMGRLNVKEIVTDSRGRLTTDVRDALNTGSVDYASDNTKKQNEYMMLDIKKNKYNKVLINTNSMTELGIKVIDVRIKQISLPIEVSDAIYNRMRAEREAVARSQRSKGQEEAEKLRASADYEVTKVLSEAQRQALIIRGEGEATVAQLFSSSFSQEPSFYSFIRSLRAYENSFKSGRDILIINPDNNYFFKYMKKFR